LIEESDCWGGKMGVLGLRQVSVWVDEAAPGGAFAHALEWAARLGLPLRGFTAASGSGPLTACARACLERGVPWTASSWQGALESAAEQSTVPAELCVVGDSLPGPLKAELLRQSWQRTPAAVLVCPRSWRPVSRVLILDQQQEAGDRFLTSAVAVCRAFQVNPVVLTIARSEREARQRQRAAEEVLAERRCPAEFDFIVGCDARTAVTWAARWRRCTHVFVERRPGPAWSRWLHGDTLRRLLDLSADLTFLALPGGGQPLPHPAEVRPYPTGREATQFP
jgi:hypothetical protein